MDITHAQARNKAQFERRQRFLKDQEKCRSMNPEERLQMALDMYDFVMQLKEAAEKQGLRPARA